MCLIGYGGFPRFSEIVGIRGCDIKFFDLYVSIFIEKSKTDKHRESSKCCQNFVTNAGFHGNQLKYSESEKL
jgi:hypothetical protein